MHNRLVVIGGGAAGMSAASAARRVNAQLDIVVVEAGAHAAYGLCGLPYYLADVITDSDELFAYSPEFFRDKRRIDVKFNTEVTALDAERKVLDVRQDGRTYQLAYDSLVFATGGAPIIPPPLAVDSDRIFTIRRLDDATRLHRLLDDRRVKRALIVGGGYIGLETAEALAARGVEVIVAEALPMVLPNFDAPVGELVHAELLRHGVDVRLGCRVESARDDGSHLQITTNGGAIEVDLMIAAVGVRAGSSVASQAGAECGPAQALVVDDHMRTSLPSVYAAGDCIAPHHLILNRPAFIPLGPAANKTGRVAGTNAAGGDAAFPGIVGTAVVKVFDLAVARTGLTLAEAEAEGIPAIATQAVGKTRAKYYPGTDPVTVRLIHRPDGRLLGAQMVGAGDGVAKRIDVAAIALQAGFDIDALLGADLSYAPPYAPVYEPILLAAQAASLRRPA
ncbi:FAD-dependent oxidoreductase [Mycolicibacterium tusciae]|uniref:FAD-dependent oxidoreductase n=1 Tax=Mycolicibacterium tusciae TaxID=75922 RepID=UPI00024A3737|nr:FAD-dependent oxidoreductase [Mycolicibacterium tusciae]